MTILKHSMTNKKWLCLHFIALWFYEIIQQLCWILSCLNSIHFKMAAMKKVFSPKITLLLSVKVEEIQKNPFCGLSWLQEKHYLKYYWVLSLLMHHASCTSYTSIKTRQLNKTTVFQWEEKKKNNKRYQMKTSYKYCKDHVFTCEAFG